MECERPPMSRGICTRNKSHGAQGSFFIFTLFLLAPYVNNSGHTNTVVLYFFLLIKKTLRSNDLCTWIDAVKFSCCTCDISMYFNSYSAFLSGYFLRGVTGKIDVKFQKGCMRIGRTDSAETSTLTFRLSMILSQVISHSWFPSLIMKYIRTHKS